MELRQQIDALVNLACAHLAEAGARRKEGRAAQEALSCIADIVAGRAELVSDSPPVVRYDDGRIVFFDEEPLAHGHGL